MELIISWPFNDCYSKTTSAGSVSDSSCQISKASSRPIWMGILPAIFWSSSVSRLSDCYATTELTSQSLSDINNSMILITQRNFETH